jgi:hypothetical protein
MGDLFFISLINLILIQLVTKDSMRQQGLYTALPGANNKMLTQSSFFPQLY